LIGAGLGDQEWSAYIVPSRFFDANHGSSFDGSGVPTAYFVTN
jgi:hypothetical protein